MDSRSSYDRIAEDDEMQTIMIIAIYANGDRLIAETPITKTSREWRSSMKNVGKSLCKVALPIKAIVIRGTDSVEYNRNEVAEIFGLEA